MTRFDVKCIIFGVLLLTLIAMFGIPVYSRYEDRENVKNQNVIDDLTTEHLDEKQRKYRTETSQGEVVISPCTCSIVGH